MKIHFRQALLLFALLAVTAALTLEGKLRSITLVVLAALAVKTWIAKLQAERIDR